jgi:glycosyltransferase involved in cell wall biosynthesis
LFVFPSWYEGFGLPVLEAFACGCPAALAATDVFREVAGEAAIFFDPLDAASMADALARGLDDAALRSRVVAEGARRLRDFSWRRMADSLAALYREVASAPRDVHDAAR